MDLATGATLYVGHDYMVRVCVCACVRACVRATPCLGQERWVGGRRAGTETPTASVAH